GVEVGANVEQWLQACGDYLPAIADEPLPTPVVRVAAGARLVRGTGAEELVLTPVPAPAVEELSRVVPLLPRLRRPEVVAVLGLELLLIVRPLEGHLVPVHDVDVAVIRHTDELAVVAEHHLAEHVDDVIEVELELQLLDPRLQRLEVPAVVGHVRGAEHDEVPGAVTAVELEQRLRHERVERDDLGLERDTELVVEVLLDQRERVLDVLGINDRPDGGPLVGSLPVDRLVPGPPRERKQGDDDDREDRKRSDPSHRRLPFLALRSAERPTLAQLAQ